MIHASRIGINDTISAGPGYVRLKKCQDPFNFVSFTIPCCLGIWLIVIRALSFSVRVCPEAQFAFLDFFCEPIAILSQLYSLGYKLTSFNDSTLPPQLPISPCWTVNPDGKVLILRQRFFWPVHCILLPAELLGLNEPEGSLR